MHIGFSTIHILFDIDGVLNRTPQLGSIRPHVVEGHVSLLQHIENQLKARGKEVVMVCESFHRHNQQVLDLLPKEWRNCATTCSGEKNIAIPVYIRNIRDNAYYTNLPPFFLIIDDQEIELPRWPHVYHYQTDGLVGLSPRDVRNILGQFWPSVIWE